MRELVGVYITFRAGKQFLTGVVISRPWDNWLPVGMDAVWQGIAGTSIELEVRERFFRIDMGNWQVSHTQEEPNLLSNYQNRSLGIRHSGEALLFDIGGQGRIRELGALWLKLELEGRISSQCYLMWNPSVELAQVKLRVSCLGVGSVVGIEDEAEPTADGDQVVPAGEGEGRMWPPRG